MSKVKHPRIALALPNFQPWGIAPFFNGISKYAQEHGWALTHCPVNPESSEDFPLDWSRLNSWKIDGIILQSNNLKQLKMLQKLKIPIVNFSEEEPITSPNIARLAQNNRKIGQLAFEHLNSLGLSHFAFHGVRGRLYSDERLLGFKQAAKEANFAIKSFCLPHMTRDAVWNERYEPIKHWLKTLPLPVGIFAVHDFRALFVLSACRELGLRVPEDVAVIGVDNDLMVCDFATPTLTSICINAYQTGLEAARLLDDLIQGKSVPPDVLRIDPSHVVARGSTDILHIQDPFVKKSVQFMQENFAKLFNIDAVAEFAGVSRRKMEICFQQELKTTPAKFLKDIRIKKAKTLMASPGRKSTEEIARLCGFGTGETLRMALRRVPDAAVSDPQQH